MGKTGWIVLIILVIIIVGGFLYYKNKQSNTLLSLANINSQKPSSPSLDELLKGISTSNLSEDEITAIQQGFA